MPYWTFDTFKFIEQKVKNKEQYDASLREAFECGILDCSILKDSITSFQFVFALLLWFRHRYYFHCL